MIRIAGEGRNGSGMTARACADSVVGAAGRALGLGFGRTGLGTRRTAAGAVRTARRLAVATARRFGFALEVGLVPTGTFELEADCGDQFFQGLLAASRAGRQPRVADALHDLKLVLAILALIFVNRHAGPRTI